jgi:succinate dehydrogenase / fumarate reductase flavoprotein subunit
VELGLIIIYKLQFQVVSHWRIKLSDHGANRLGASALMQGLADGYFVLPYTIGDYLSPDIKNGTYLY